MTDALIRVDGVTKSFVIQKGWRDLLRSPLRTDRQPVLRGVNLHVGAGEFFGVLGQNGAGKSTLFRILAGLVLPDQGAVTVHGIDVLSNPRLVRTIVAPVTPSERSLYWRLSATENLRLFGSLYGVTGPDLPTRIAETLAVVGLGNVRHKQVGLFSSGMKQRLLIARALLPRPRVLLLDEPTRSLDPVSAREFRHFLRDEISRQQQCTVLLATHDHEEVRDLCDRIGVLHHGELILSGRTEQVLESMEHQRLRIRVAHDDAALAEESCRTLGFTVLERSAAEADGWCWLRITIPGAQEPDALFRAVAGTGARIARIEREPLTLADLLVKAAAYQPDRDLAA